MGETLLDQIETHLVQLARLVHTLRQEQEAQAIENPKAPAPRIQDNPTTNAPAHETQPEQLTQARGWGDPLADVLGFPKDGR